MNKNIFKTLFVSFIVLFSALFINIDGVKAEDDYWTKPVTNGDGKGYATCYYQWDESMVDNGAEINYSGSDMVSLGTKYRPYKLGVTVYKGNDGNIYGWADVGCGEKEGNSFTKQTTGHCNIDNYNYYFNNMKNFTNYFIDSNGNWTCPDKIYLNKDNQNDNMSLFFSKDYCASSNSPWGCTATKSLSQNASSQSGQPGRLVVRNYKTQNKDTESQTVTDQLNSITEGNSDWTKIWNWGKIANEGEYTSDDVGTTCNSVSEIGEFLNNLLWIINIIAIIILIIMTAADFIKAIVGSEDDTLKKAFKNFVIRAIIIVILFLLPLILGAIIRMMNNETGTVEIGENGQIFCNVAKDK